MPLWLVLVVVVAALACGFIGYRIGHAVFLIPLFPNPCPVTAVLLGENAAWVGTASTANSWRLSRVWSP